jgi:hypothetical protein
MPDTPTFDDNLSSDELRNLTLQFLGQHVTGPMKEIEKTITTRNANLQGLTINPRAIIDSIPHVPYTTTVNAGINATHAPIQNNIPRSQPQINVPVVVNDPNQLEFDFNNSNYAKLIFDRLDSIDRHLAAIETQSKS